MEKYSLYIMKVNKSRHSKFIKATENENLDI